jgi:NDP-sugar pyrophosphorylase family protein
MNILIPMAGRGKRFVNQNFTLPKPLIDIMGKPMVQRAVESLDFQGKWFFLIREDEYADELRKLIEVIKPESVIIAIDYVTEGPASSALLFREFINNDEPLLIANCDQIMEWDSQRFLDYVSVYDGAVVTYHTDTEKNSYARINKNGLVQEIKEKDVISNVSLIGIHWWRCGKFFVDSAQQMIAVNDRAYNGEFYVGPSYNYMINQMQNVGIFHIPNQQFHPVGVPDDLKKYIAYETSKS